MKSSERNDARVKRTYAQLINGLVVLLNEKSFDDVSVLEICEASGVHRATFYKHFNDKFEFLNFCFDSMLETISFDSLKLGSSPSIIKSNIMHFISCILEFIDDNRPLFTSACIVNPSIAFLSSFDNAINNFCTEKLNSVLTAPSHRIEISSVYYSGAFVGVVKWYIQSNNPGMYDDMMDFLGHRVDELCSFYETNLYGLQ
ncbi:MAG: TetR/AcrR family transcriptional regulator [Clostridia bacterium]|nr:TetR/AcrR family transcriptional regulator [Clostridia bacterium]